MIYLKEKRNNNDKVLRGKGVKENKENRTDNRGVIENVHHREEIRHSGDN